jgi:hypothetical protein
VLYYSKTEQISNHIGGWGLSVLTVGEGKHRLEWKNTYEKIKKKFFFFCGTGVQTQVLTLVSQA